MKKKALRFFFSIKTSYFAFFILKSGRLLLSLPFTTQIRWIRYFAGCSLILKKLVNIFKFPHLGFRTFHQDLKSMVLHASCMTSIVKLFNFNFSSSKTTNSWLISSIGFYSAHLKINGHCLKNRKPFPSYWYSYI